MGATCDQNQAKFEKKKRKIETQVDLIRPGRKLGYNLLTNIV